MIKYKIFNKLVLALFILLLVCSVLFTITQKINESIMRKNLEESTKKQLDYSVEQFEKDLHQLEVMSILLINDRSIKSFSTSYDFSSRIDHLLKRKYVEEKLKIQQNVIGSNHAFTIYWPQTNEIISTNQEDRKSVV